MHAARTWKTFFQVARQFAMRNLQSNLSLLDWAEMHECDQTYMRLPVSLCIAPLWKPERTGDTLKRRVPRYTMRSNENICFQMPEPLQWSIQRVLPSSFSGALASPSRGSSDASLSRVCCSSLQILLPPNFTREMCHGYRHHSLNVSLTLIHC